MRLNCSEFDKRDATWHKITGSVAMNQWARFVGLLLIAVVVIIVIAPDVDLPPTVTRSSHLGHRILLIPFSAVIHAGMLLLPQSSIRLLVPVVLSRYNDSSGSLIDLNCARLC